MALKTFARVVLGISIGLAVGVGGYTFLYAGGGSYLTNNPAACANCHVMREHYDGWVASSHRSVATCNDCHTPMKMGPKGPEPDMSRMLSGHPEDVKITAPFKPAPGTPWIAAVNLSGTAWSGWNRNSEPSWASAC